MVARDIALGPVKHSIVVPSSSGCELAMKLLQNAFLTNGVRRDPIRICLEEELLHRCHFGI